MKKHLKGLLLGIVTVLLSLTMLLAACTESEPSSGSSESSSNSENTNTDSTDNTGDSTDNTGDSTSEDSGSSGGGSSEVTVTEVTLSYTSLKLNAGDSSAISATVTTSDGSEYTGGVTWTTNNEAVAAVTGSDTSATINALTAGTATIKAEAGGVGAECSVTVTELTIEGLTAAGAYAESIYATWDADSVSGAAAYYKLSSAQDADNNWTEIDGNLIRMSDGDGRVDVVGLAAGYYDLKVIVNGTTATASNIAVSEYDRSGYAHYNTSGYDGGVGAYNDDGTLKDGALVIYLTEKNKNDVSDYCYVYTGGTYTKADITQYLVCNDSANITLYGSRAQVGIGEILNNRRYSGNDRHNVGIAALCDAYGAVTIRVIGTVEADVSSDGVTSTITGLTDYDATTNGGSEGDNGRMARMVNAHDLTIEGVGTDASIFGWGLHFIANDTTNSYQSSEYGSGAGKSFEVRNITFESYPEDAIGMEGIQGTSYNASTWEVSGSASASADLLSPVEYCWIHNNSFLPGYCAKPAESDKAEGDGSCDFKRGQYYTLSYNYFEYCHKTNLIGSSDSSLQYNISMHHNYWYNCGSRIPLARRANIHFYNNYVYADVNDSKAELSYVHSVRANSYLYAENNYYEGCKNVLRGGAWEGGAEKSYGNAYFQCFSTATPAQAATRTTAVANSCAFTYRGIDYSSFDTDSSKFYYDDSTQTSDCYLTDAVTARKEAITGASVNKAQAVADTDINEVTPSSSIVVGEEGLTVDLSQVNKGASTVSGVEFTNITGVSSSTVKGKGQLVTFTLASEAQLTVSCTASTLLLGELVGADGTVYANKFSDLTIILQAGTYVIASGEADKELTISSISFADTAASSDARVAAATTALGALGTYTGYSAEELAADTTLLDEFESAVTAAQTAYSALTATELTQIDGTLKAALDTAVTLLNNAKADFVEAYIAAIGEVTQDSYTAINTARTAYNALTADQKALVSNYSALTDAETAYEQYAVTNVENMISALVDVSTVTISDRDALEAAITAYEEAQEAYNALDDGETGTDNPINNVGAAYVTKLAGLADLEEMYVIYNFVDLLDSMDTDVTLSDSADVTALTTYYNALTNTEGAYYTQFNAMLSGNYASYVTKYNTIIDAYGALASQSMVITFADSSASTYYSNYGNVTTSGTTASNKTAITYEGVTYSVGLKLNSSGYITITTSTSMNITLYCSTDNSGNKIAIGSDVYTVGSDGTITAAVTAGTITIARSSGESCLYVAVLTPAA